MDHEYAMEEAFCSQHYDKHFKNHFSKMQKSSKTLIKGNVIVEEIKIGDIHYEYDMGIGIKCKVMTRPVKNSDGNWEWESENVNTGKKINYLVNPKYPHYSVNLYDYEAYTVKHYV